MSSEQEPAGILLFVDDEASILRSLQRLFIPLGYEVHVATSGAVGLKLLEENDIDVIISDMRMPEMDGAAFLHEAANRWPDIKRLLLTGYSDINSAVSAINEGKIDYYINKPWKDNQLEVAIQNALDSKRLKAKNKELEAKIQQQNEELKLFNTALEEKVLARTQQLRKAYRSLQKTYQSSIEVLSSVIEMFEGEENKGYYRKIANTAKTIAQAIKLSDTDIQTIYFASLLHDIGKIGMPAHILKKPFTLLDAKESNQYRKYPLLGEAALMAFEPLRDAAHIILTHRERIEGSGYPHQLKGEAIPVGARILSIIIDFIELQRGLLINEKLTASQALAFIQSNSGTYYDPCLVEIFIGAASSLLDQEVLLNEVSVSSEQLEEGMRLSRDLTTQTGIRLLSKGELLSQQHIDKLKKIGQLTLYITNTTD